MSGGRGKGRGRGGGGEGRGGEGEGKGEGEGGGMDYLVCLPSMKNISYEGISCMCSTEPEMLGMVF
jgi:hypothetical protein